MNLYDTGNLSLLTDLYELTMLQGYFYCAGKMQAVFDISFRKLPFNGGYAVFAGLEPLVKAILNMKFTEYEINYLKSLKIFKEEFLEDLYGFKFSGDIYSVEEGEVVFPREPLVRIHASIMEAQLLESLVLNIINFQTLIATKTARIVNAANGREVSEFGLRRAHGIDGALSASRAAFIGGAKSTSNTLAGKIFNIPVKGTMAHSWIMAFKTEEEAFNNYIKIYPETSVLLVDTYDTLCSGIPAAITVFKKLKKQGIKRFGIRLDSGDLEYLSKKARSMLDKAGFNNAIIVASNELDEYVIEQLIKNNAPIDIFGVGTNLVTAKGDSSLTGVYKLVALKEKRHYKPKIKVSDNVDKVTSPHVKNILRFYDKKSQMLGDCICLESESANLETQLKEHESFIMFHPDYEYKRKKITGYSVGRMLLKNVVKKGEVVYNFPALSKIQNKAEMNLKGLHASHKRLLNPHLYKVGLSKKLKEMKSELIRRYS
jgi:nicotinate phosphoribosyltransferase